MLVRWRPRGRSGKSSCFKDGLEMYGANEGVTRMLWASRWWWWEKKRWWFTQQLGKASVYRVISQQCVLAACGHHPFFCFDGSFGMTLNNVIHLPTPRAIFQASFSWKLRVFILYYRYIPVWAPAAPPPTTPHIWRLIMVLLVYESASSNMKEYWNKSVHPKQVVSS